MADYDDQLDDLEPIPTLIILADLTGKTAMRVLNAASQQFDEGVVRIRRLSQVANIDQVRNYLDKYADPDVPTAVFHTIVNYNLRDAIRIELDKRGIPSIDLLSPTISVIQRLTGQEPKNIPGIVRENDKRFDARLTGMEFFAEHDDGSNPQDLSRADAVLFGVTRTQKTPLSLYLSFLGYRVANVTFSSSTEVPEELFKVDPKRVFGMLTRAGMPKGGDGQDVPDPNSTAALINLDQYQAIEIMEKIGCTMIEIDGKTIEDLAQVVIDQLKEID
ncbi:MAG: kinase/pyrophosphorylase [Atopobiaceae bacterium]|nr:kinase/pyrophosphorylase [Atopobiaceae bacterium]